jgi:hypothetical protein
MQLTVFVSNHHSPEEDAFTARIVADLEAAGAEVFVDHAFMETGDLVRHFRRESTAQKWFVLVVTPAAMADARVNYQTILAALEWRAERLQGVLPLVLKPCPEEHFNVLTRSLHLYDGIVCDATTSYEVGRDQLLDALTSPPQELPKAAPSIPIYPIAEEETPPGEITIDLATVRLARGCHRSPAQGVSVMELVSYLAHEPFSDYPKTASVVITIFLRYWNDALDDNDRQMLLPYAAQVVGTASSPEIERRRALLVLDWQRRTFLPTWLRLAGLERHATACEELPPLTTDSLDVREQAREVVDDAKRDAYSDYDGAVHDYSVFDNPEAYSYPYSDSIDGQVGTIARDAVEAAAGSAAEYAADLAAEPDYQAAAWDSAWNAVNYEIWDPAKYDAEYASWSDAEADAWSAARYAAGLASASIGWKAAWKAAKYMGRSAYNAAIEGAVRETLAPTVAQLQQSALRLLERMIACRLDSGE